MYQVKIGRAAELIVQAKALLHGLEVFTPATEDGRIDLLVGPHHYRCQVKALGLRMQASVTRYLHMVKRQGRAGSLRRFRYTEQDVDFMIGVCLDSMAVYVVPIASTAAWSHCISEQALERMGTKEAFHLLAAAPGEAEPEVPPCRMIGRRPKPRCRASRRRPEYTLPLGLEFTQDAERRAG